MNDWYEVYFKDSNTLEKLKPDSTLVFELKQEIEIHTLNYKDALFYNAKKVADSINGPLNILLSGGVDSEVIVRINKELGIKQNVYTFKFEDNLNIRDIESALEISRNLNVPIKVIDFNLRKFFNNDAESYYKKTFCSKVETLPRLQWHEFFDSPIIFGNGEPYLRRVLQGDYTKKSPWKIVFQEYDFLHYLYSLSIPWYHFTPEIYGNILKISLIKNLIDDKIPGKQSSASSKALINREIYKEILLKPKLVGYEGKDMPPGSIPDFMKEFKDEVMSEVTDSEIFFDSEKWQGYFKLKQ